MEITINETELYCSHRTKTIFAATILNSGSDMVLALLDSSEPLAPYFLSYIELTLCRKAVQTLSITLNRKSPEWEELLLSQGYLLKDCTFTKKLSPQKTWRISLTEKCNYRCFFCHEEGMDMKTKRGNVNFSDLFDIICEGVRGGHTTDITFTGGEPLLQRKELIQLINKMDREDILPSLTIGTNGVLINEELLQALRKYRGTVKFNISFHASEWETYQKIVCIENRENYNRLHKIIPQIIKFGFKVKLNVVLLKGLNTDRSDILSILNFAHSHEIHTVKFLELLVTENLIDFYPYYYEVQALIPMLKGDLIHFSQGAERQTFRWKNSSLLVELQTCPCKQGCDKCLLTTGRVFTAQLEYHPCFLLNDRAIPLSKDSMNSTFVQGENEIAVHAERYGSKSPLVVNDPDFVPGKIDMYYRLSSDISSEVFIKQLQESNCVLIDRSDFIEHYYQPAVPSPSWSDFKRVLKIVQCSHNEEEFQEIIQKLAYREIPYYCTEVEFLYPEGPKNIDSFENLDRYYTSLEFEKTLTLQWELFCYERDGQSLNFGINTESGIRTVKSTSPLRADFVHTCKLELITEPLLVLIQRELSEKGA